MNATRSEHKEHIIGEVLATMRQRHSRQVAWMIALAAVCAAGLVAWVIQLREGLEVTAMRDHTPWGMYIALLFFFVGVSLVGALISSVLRFTHAHWRHPLVRIAEAVTLSAVLFAGFMPILDMGRPERLLNMFTYGRLQSPIIWDVAAILAYLVGSIIYFYLPLIPDLAIMRDRMTDLSAWRHKLYRAMALGWQDLPAQRTALKKAMNIMTVVILPVAISVHTISAWLLAMTLRPGWNTGLMGPYFVFGALMAGCAIMILVVFLVRHGYGLRDLLTPLHFQRLGMLLLALCALYFYLNVNKYAVPAYKMEKSEAGLLRDLFTGHYAWMFWGTQIGGLLVPMAMLVIARLRRSTALIIGASVLVLLGALINRFIILVPNMLHPLVPMQHHDGAPMTYHPTLVEWTITAASLAGFVLVIMLLFRVFPVITMWEVAEDADPRIKDGGQQGRNSSGLKGTVLLMALLLAASLQAQDVKPGGRIEMRMAANDSMHQVMVRISEVPGGRPIAGVEPALFVQRTFGRMSIGSAITDSTGTAIVEFEKNMPAMDASGRFVVVAIVEDDDHMRDTTASVIATASVPFPPDRAIGPSLISPRAPKWLVLLAVALAGAILWAYAYAVTQMIRIARAPRAN